MTATAVGAGDWNAGDIGEYSCESVQMLRVSVCDVNLFFNDRYIAWEICTFDGRS